MIEQLMIAALILGVLIDFIWLARIERQVKDIDERIQTYAHASKRLTQIVHDMHRQQHDERFMTPDQRLKKVRDEEFNQTRKFWETKSD